MDSIDGVAVEVADGVLRITLDRPERKNALDPPAMARIVEALEGASTDDALRAILLRSSGGDFCAGADWVARNTGDGPRPRAGSIQRRTPVQAHRLIALLLEVQLPVVCRVRGWAAGLGFQLALVGPSQLGPSLEPAEGAAQFAHRFDLTYFTAVTRISTCESRATSRAPTVVRAGGSFGKNSRKTSFSLACCHRSGR